MAKQSKQIGYKQLYKLFLVLSLVLLFLAIIIFIGFRGGAKDGNSLSFFDRFSHVLGVATSQEIQERNIVAKKVAEADKLLSAVPNPVAQISMEGKLSTDPKYIQTVKSLADVSKVFTLSYAYKATNKSKYSDKALEFILAWARVYKASGNSIDESHLEPLFEGYAMLSSAVTINDRETINNWLKTIAEKEIAIKYNDGRDINNWNSHRINIIGQIGYLTNDSKYINYSIDAFKKQVQDNLMTDGSSLDFQSRDALHYHCYDIWPMLFFAKTAALHGVDLYNYQAPSGSSLQKSVHFLYPFITGEKVHLEFINSTAAWDKVSGSKKLNAANANKWNPQNGLYIVELAYFFDDSSLPMVQKIRNNYSEFPSFEILLAYQQRRGLTNSAN